MQIWLDGSKTKIKQQKLFQGCIKFMKPVGDEYKVVKRGKYYHGKEGKGKHYHLPFNIKAVGKNIKWGRAEGGQKLR